MNKKVTIILTAVLLVIVTLGYFFFLKPSKQFESKTALFAIPNNTPLVIAIKNPIKAIDHVTNNELYTTIRSIESVENDLAIVNTFKNQVNNDELFHKLLKGKDLFLSFNLSGRNHVNLLSILSLKSSNDIELINKLLNKIKANNNVQYSNRKYNKSIIHEIKNENGSYYLAVHNGIAIFSQKSLLVEESIRQSDNELSQENPDLQPLLKTVGVQSDIQLFINHENIDKIFTNELSKNLKRKATLLKLFSNWTELDVSTKDDKLILSGFSNGNNSSNLYGNVFLNQQPVNSNIEKVLPQSTSFYLGISLSDITAFFNDYEQFLEKRNLNFNREAKISNIEKTTGINIQDLMVSNTNQEIVISGISVDQNAPHSGRVWVIETKSGSTALNQFLELQQKYLTSKGVDNSGWQKDYEIDNQTSFTIHKFPYPQMPEILFGEIFKEINASWFTIYENYLIFGDSYRSVAKTVHANVLGETLSESMDYDQFKSNLNSRSNINFYCNTALSLPVAGLFFNEENSKVLSSNEELRKFKAFAWQVSSTGEMLYNNTCLYHNNVVKNKPQTIWQSHIPETFDCKPKFVTNHYDRANKEIVLYDNANNFYLINNIGRVMWQVKLDAPILGEIHQIDYFKNGKLQYLFNTQNKLYLIDRNGNPVKNFPINFRSKATNPVSIFDYDNNKEYRFFVACEDLKIYAYNKLGKTLQGWNMYKTDHPVYHPIQHFRVEGKDYIVANDKMKDYILHRKGTVRVKTNKVYPHSINNKIYLETRTSANEPRLVSTEDNGTIHYTYLDGRHEIKNQEKLDEFHHFTIANIDQTDDYEYIYTNGNQLIVQKSNGKQVLKKRFNETISHPPHVYSFSSSMKKIGITCERENKIHLIDAQGNSHPGFPLDGCTEFSIGFISSEKSNFNLLVGSPDSYLYNYYVE